MVSRTRNILMIPLMLLFCASTTAQISIGGYNVYFGSLHNHSSISDGVGTPDSAYYYAKNISQLDFFGLSDHSDWISTGEWDSLRMTADMYNEEGVFVTFWGFEWTSNIYGHVTVTNTLDYCTTDSPYNTFSGFCAWLDSHECIAFFNHPGREDDSLQEFNHFSAAVSGKFAGIELWNRTDGFIEYYYNDGYYENDGGKGYFDEALLRDFRIGAMGGEDNHTGDWGNYSDYRMAILAPAKTRKDIRNALMERRFYSTLDQNLALSFKIDGNEMGSTVIPGIHTMYVQATDNDGEIFTIIKLVKNGEVINTWNVNSVNPVITESITCGDHDYFYVIVEEADSDEAISSPVWCSAPNQPPILSITNPQNNASYNAPALVNITVTASDEDGTVTKVEFFRDLVKLGEDEAAPYTYDWINVPAGTYIITAKATDNEGSQTNSLPVTIHVTANGDVIASSFITNGFDDAEENEEGGMQLESSKIELVCDTAASNGNQVVGLRFQNMGVPCNAVIKNAYVQFTSAEPSAGDCALWITGEASDNSARFNAEDFNISGRPETEESVSWLPEDWMNAGESGEGQRTPDVKDIIQEIVNRSGYNFSSALTLFITGNGTRTAKAFEGSATQSAKMVITYSTAPVANFIASQTTIFQGTTIHFTDLSTHEPASWNWSFPGGTPSSSTNRHPNITYYTPGTYSVTLIVSNSGGSDTLTRVNYIQVNQQNYCASKSLNFMYEYISKFTLGNFVKYSGGSNYSDFTNIIIPVQANTSYTIKITPTFKGPKRPEYFKVWIDYNDDHDFNDPGENIVTGIKNGELTATFITPPIANATRRLRVAMKRNWYPGPCEIFAFGEVEDYTVSFGFRSEMTIIDDPAVENNADPGFTIYPNPAIRSLFIEKTEEGIIELEIYSIQGQRIWKSSIETNVTEIDISRLQPGIYVIRSINNASIGSQRFIVY